MPYFSKYTQGKLQSYIKNIEGLDNIPSSEAFILAANHNNHLDSFILASLFQVKLNRQVKVLSRKDIIIWKIIGKRGAKRLSAILIDRTKKEECLNVALDELNQGNIIVIYPEAQLNDKDYLLKPRTGVARLALWSGLPVLPVGISEGPGAHGSIKLLFDVLFSFNNSTKLKFGKPLQFEKYHEKQIPEELLEETSNQIMKAIAPLCGKSFNK